MMPPARATNQPRIASSGRAPSAQDSEPITALAVSPDNRTLVASSRSLMCKVWDLQTGESRRSWKVGGGGGAAATRCRAASQAAAAGKLRRSLAPERSR
jgi:WD40 repeat protein